MRLKIPIPNLTKEHFFKWLSNLNKDVPVCLLNSNQYAEVFELLIGIDSIDEIVVKSNNSFSSLQNYFDKHNDWLLGYFNYDLKNEIEDLNSKNYDRFEFPSLHFFRPKFLFEYKAQSWRIHVHVGDNDESKQLISEILSFRGSVKKNSENIHLKNRVSKSDYLTTVGKILAHIQKGDIYEMNFCQEFYAEDTLISAFEIYENLNKISPMPFSAYYSHNGKYLMSASPERFIKKTGNKIISQPIKGTTKRGKTEEEDKLLKDQLFNNPKERSENVMIVDLVRNDLSKTAKKGSVKVDELFGIYSFNQVHQMISTVSSELEESISFIEVIKNAFPMGSMTGAPKVRAMELIEKYESTKRGLYSGAVGYITPEGNFDFNVVIRSILYNSEKKYLSFMVGSAITANSDAEKEYEECLLKAEAMMKTVKE